MRKEQFKKLFIFLIALTYIDFFLTYIGINFLEFIEEKNPFLIWLFELPFLQSLFLRSILISVTVFFPLWLFKKLKEDYIVFNAIRGGIFINLVLLVLHLRWLILFIIY